MASYVGSFKILLLSELEVDKSTLVWRDVSNISPPDEKLNVGLEFILKTVVIDNKNYKLQLWDLSGEKRFRFLMPQYYLGANGAVILYDVTKSQTLDNIDEQVNIVREKCGDIPIMLVGILLDEKSERQVSEEEAKKIANSRNLSGYIECGPKMGENVEKVFEGLTRLIIANRSFTPPQKKVEDLSKPNYLMKKKRLDSENNFKSKSKTTSPKIPSKTPLIPTPPKPPENPELSPQDRETDPDQIIIPRFLVPFEFSDARWIICPICRRKIAVEDFKNHSCMGIMLDTEKALSQLSSSVSRRANIDSQLKGEVQAFLDWIKDKEGLSGHINYSLQENNTTIISELSKIYADLREIFGI